MPRIDVALECAPLRIKLRIVSQPSRRTGPANIPHPASKLVDGDGGIVSSSNGEQRMNRAVLIVDPRDGLPHCRRTSQRRAGRRSMCPSVSRFQVVNSFSYRSSIILNLAEKPPEYVKTGSSLLIARNGGFQHPHVDLDQGITCAMQDDAAALRGRYRSC